MKAIVAGLASWRAVTTSLSRKRERVRERENYLARRPPRVTAADAEFSSERSALARLQDLATHVRDLIDSDNDR